MVKNPRLLITLEERRFMIASLHRWFRGEKRGLRIFSLKRLPQAGNPSRSALLWRKHALETFYI